MSRRPKLILFPALLSMLALATSVVLAQTATPSPIPPPSVTPGPTVYYVGTAATTPTPGCAAPLAFAVDSLVYVSGGVYVRTEPTGSSPWVNYYEQSTVVRITGTPVCDGVHWNWWPVRGPGNDGWVAEGDPINGYWMQLAAPPEGVTPCNPPADLNIGKRALVLNDVNLHDAANMDGLVLTVVPSGSFVNVLEGPVCANGYNYWRVQAVVVNVLYTGWVADGQTDGTPWLQDEFFLATPVCAPPMRLSVGSQAYVNYKGNSPKNLRTAPSINAALVATLLDGIGFEVIGGPVCGQGWL